MLSPFAASRHKISLFVSVLSILCVCTFVCACSNADTTPPSFEKIPPAGQSALILPGPLVVPRIQGPISTDPGASYWSQTTETKIPLYIQRRVKPASDALAVEHLRVRQVHNGEWIAWRIEWDDPSADGVADTDTFTDSVAIQFPTGADIPSPSMGHPKTPVHIIQWRAQWQTDIDVGFQDIDAIHPNYHSDLYWFAEKQGDRYPIPGAFKNPVSLQWFIAVKSGNPISVWSREQPVAEMNAQGFSTSTTQERTAAIGRGAWKAVNNSGVWSVVIARPLKTDDPLDAQFIPGQSAKMAFAAWEGSKEQRGARKQWSGGWIDFKILE